MLLIDRLVGGWRELLLFVFQDSASDPGAARAYTEIPKVRGDYSLNFLQLYG